MKGTLLILLAAGLAWPQRSDFPALQLVSESETVQEAGLTSQETEQIVQQIRETSFDFSDSWALELRARRVRLGATEGLVVRGSKLLCGGTGNCQTWVFRRPGSRWMNMFRDQAPIASGFAFEPQVSRGVKNLVLGSNLSAETERYAIYRFDGTFYVAVECYEASVRAGKIERVRQVRCI